VQNRKRSQQSNEEQAKKEIWTNLGGVFKRHPITCFEPQQEQHSSELAYMLLCSINVSFLLKSHLVDQVDIFENHNFVPHYDFGGIHLNKITDAIQSGDDWKLAPVSLVVLSRLISFAQESSL